MDFEEALISHISARVPSLANLIMPEPLNQHGKSPDELESLGLLPACTYSEQSHTYPETIDGYYGVSNIMEQLQFWSTRRSSAKSLREQVRQVLQGFHGTMGTGAGVEILQLMCERGGPTLRDIETNLYYSILTIDVKIAEPIPALV